MKVRRWLLSGSVLSKREGPEEVFITYYGIPGTNCPESRSRFSSYVRHETRRNHGIPGRMSGGLDLEPAASSLAWVDEANRLLQRARGILKVHLWIDTGMSREGVCRTRHWPLRAR